MTTQELQHKIYLWKTVSNDLKNENPDLFFIEALIDRIEELEEEYE